VMFRVVAHLSSSDGQNGSFGAIHQEPFAP